MKEAAVKSEELVQSFLAKACAIFWFWFGLFFVWENKGPYLICLGTSKVA